ncbi:MULTISPECIES: VRR-NUC domain-containing protein [unclassified Caballeronia]|uniref:VRR-NUC domain-containing protein n=1 Tax=unclassified Caballeronia TaxID=2646786 RepID=UPI00285D89EF|nr:MULTISPECIES: VRR-NUC domain-containing protein [unclassified Caballeronia]MDR5772108.1 VRR-NUC domain-containing protein [Caballeronia sp. LZ002]MDR5847542.1 VRR-NUC domain-containing protein [Caballeronia sp. LZ003]
MLEKDVEAYLVARMQDMGGLAIKFISPGRRNVPDRIVIFPSGKIVFVELKATGKTPNDAQIREHARLRRLNCAVYGCIDSKSAVDRMIEDIAPLL